MEITEQLAAALHELVRASDAAEKSSSDRQAARRAVERSRLVVQLAKREGFGSADSNEAD